MNDHTTQGADLEDPMPQIGEPGDQAETEERSYNTLASILLLVVVIVVILVLWRSCGSETGSGDSSRSDAVIATVEELPQEDEGVSLWVRPGVSIDDVLSRNGLGGTEAIDMGDGTYVIAVERDATAVVDQLKADPGLYDAGFLYAED